MDRYEHEHEHEHEGPIAEMRNGTCTHCGQTTVFAKPQGIDGALLNGKKVPHTDYLCVNCGAFEQYFTDPDTLDQIVRRAEQLGDWKRVAPDSA